MIINGTLIRKSPLLLEKQSIYLSFEMLLIISLMIFLIIFLIYKSVNKNKFAKEGVVKE